MKYVDEFRDAATCRQLAQAIAASVSRPRTIMEVCGGQTHGLLRHGIDRELAGAVELIHGPGCPVCVTAAEEIDFAIALTRLPHVIVTSFGDMLRVPGSQESLLTARSRGGHVRLVYSPRDALRLAQEQPDREVVFFAVGFETTAPATALAVQQAARLGVRNFSLLAAHVRVLPGMRALAAAPDCRLEGFLAAGHVCTVTGFADYHRLAAETQRPIVVTGFEPVDLLRGILACVRHIERHDFTVENAYTRVAREQGNERARQCIESVYEPCDQTWRGMGIIPGGGLRLRENWWAFDARRRFANVPLPPTAPSPCRGGDVLAGRIKPPECPLYGRECTPATPAGAPMISAEGACAAYYHYTGGATALGTCSQIASRNSR